jgi:hypothetical protein
MENIKPLLEEFDNILRINNFRNFERLYPPLPEEKIINYVKQLEINDKDFEDLYRWKNGFDPNRNIDEICQIFDFDTLLSIEWILDKVEINKGDPIWNNFFIPLITDTTGQFLLFNNKSNGDYGKIHLYSPSLFFIDEPISYYDSISAMIETTIQAYKHGALKYDSIEDWLEEDVPKFREIAKKINKNSKYWQLLNK